MELRKGQIVEFKCKERAFIDENGSFILENGKKLLFKVNAYGTFGVHKSDPNYNIVAVARGFGKVKWDIVVSK